MRHATLFLSLLMILPAWSDSVRAADEEIVFACNYTIRLTIDGIAGAITTQSRVRNNSHIPINLRDYELRLGASSTDTDMALVKVTILERADDTLREIYPRPLSFEAPLGAPTEFSYRDEFLEIEIALIVSVLSR